MTIKKQLVFLLFLGLIACKNQKENYIYASETLKIKQLSEHTFQHISYLNIQKYGKVACNGMIVINEGEALVFDTPVNDSDSKELIEWIENTLKCKTKGIVATHYHSDCLGGLNEFNSRQIPSYSLNQTIDLAKSNNMVIPQNGFDNYLELEVGNKLVVNEYMGEGHTKDNIICFFPHDNILFGGCLIKEIGAGKGNLADANTEAWPTTVKRIKSKYQNTRIIIPGHGKTGTPDLLNYTIELFSND